MTTFRASGLNFGQQQIMKFNSHSWRKLTMRIIKSSALTLAVFSTFIMTNSFAATSPQTINVALAGEAEQPMKIDVDKKVLKAGVVEFLVSNEAIGTDHEMILVKLTNKDAEISADPKTHRINEKKLKSMGEVAGLKAGDKGKLEVKLAPGEYALICNHKSHYELGMAIRITVTN
jgi:uncharacterized cupredoxin-like copper-binding protein